MVNIKIIAGSTRPGRFNTQVAEWVYEQSKQLKDAEVELIDLATVNLPLLDEAVPPSAGKYEHDHTKQWAETVDEADGFLIVAPEYNHSMSAALKNALDFVYKEWNFKPVSFVSYGSGAGGARSVEHLRGVAGELKMYDLRDQLLIPNYWDDLDEEGKYKFTQEQAEAVASQLRELTFWSEQMKRARQDLGS